MSAIYVPSIWDYIAQAGTAGLQSYQQSKDRKEEEAAKKRAEAMQGLQMMLQLEGSGLMGYQDVNNQIQQMQGAAPWLKSAMMSGPSVGGLQAQIANTPDKVPELQPLNVQNAPAGTVGVVAPVVKPSAPPPKMVSGIDQFTDAQRQRAGYKTRAEVAAQEQDFARRSAQEARDAQTFKDQQVLQPLNVIRTVQPLIQDAAARHVAEYMNKNKGRLDPKTLPVVAASAYDKFSKTPDGKKLMEADPSASVYARSYFEQAVQEAYKAQVESDQKLAIARLAAGGRGMQPNDVANTLNNISKNLASSADDMMQRLGFMGSIINADSNWRATASPDVIATYEKIQSLRSQAQDMAKLSAGVLSGFVSPEQAQQAVQQYMMSGLPIGGGQQSQGAGIPPTNPGMIPAMGGKRKITADQAAFLRSRGQFDPNLYEVAK